MCSVRMVIGCVWINVCEMPRRVFLWGAWLRKHPISKVRHVRIKDRKALQFNSLLDFDEFSFSPDFLTW